MAKTDAVEKPDMAWRLIGAVVALGVGFATRKAIEFGWQKATGKKPPADPNSLETGLAEAVGFAVVLGVGMEVARIVATRSAHKRYQAWKAVTDKAERVVGA
ncbi:hypothetical protein Sme01_07680 [Sphaerisporangium melleum]|uniref:DUF4235 domain-containing protein n=1 Tax=Sphaerisporangium melleum TaxID=321316 RepID=A0A917VEZ8_9ACTN|nr:DUF4235 domain-containing protein [Sphaerisporangium melleum]GGK72804.1 hypothetical protein GCM10007964_14510 [Sphaerisporangium melleum]GII68292.1 hypothetical protein Sme01_07680 [Sphaerisporangium melleum]